MGIALIVILIILLMWPTIMKWISRFMARRAEDYLRKATGMPPRPGSRQAKKEARQRANAANQQRRAYGRQYANQDYDPDGPIIPREYAEDVEFVETKNYSETNIGTVDSDGRRHVRYHESQVSDVEWEEIKTNPNAKK